MQSKIQLVDFNNLTKSLSFNMYDICYADTPALRQAYFDYIDETYNAMRLTETLREVTQIIGAEILNIGLQDYEPHGASTTILVAEGKVNNQDDIYGESPGPMSESVVAHLDKSHIAAHTYPECHPNSGICTFRVDIDVATCGLISPLKALNYLMHSFDVDVVAVDYRVRGFTRDTDGKKHYIDHDIHSIQNFFPDEIKSRYIMQDINLPQHNLFHTKMRLKQFDADQYLYDSNVQVYDQTELRRIESLIKQEMDEIFQGGNTA